MRQDLVRPMASYSGYGAAKFKPMLKSLSDGEWPVVFSSSGTLHVGLMKFSNFFQLPVRVKSISSVSGGHEVKVDVFSDQAMTNRIYSGLTTITVSGTPIDDSLSVGAEGFFTWILGYLYALESILYFTHPHQKESAISRN